MLVNSVLHLRTLDPIFESNKCGYIFPRKRESLSLIDSRQAQLLKVSIVIYTHAFQRLNLLNFRYLCKVQNPIKECRLCNRIGNKKKFSSSPFQALKHINTRKAGLKDSLWHQ